MECKTKLRCAHTYMHMHRCVCVPNYTYHKHVFSNNYTLLWVCVAMCMSFCWHVFVEIEPAHICLPRLERMGAGAVFLITPLQAIKICIFLYAADMSRSDTGGRACGRRDEAKRLAREWTHTHTRPHSHTRTHTCIYFHLYVRVAATRFRGVVCYFFIALKTHIYMCVCAYVACIYVFTCVCVYIF